MMEERREAVLSAVRPDLREHAVAYKARDTHCGPWLDLIPEGMRRARIRYDAGTHEMVQVGTKTHFVLISMPRRQKAERCDFEKFHHAKGPVGRNTLRRIVG